MHYFIGNNLGKTLTGIEKAQLNRLKLFEAYGMKAKCVYVAFNPQLHENAQRFNVSSDVFTIYDYFQQAVDYQGEKLDWIQYFKACGYQLKYIANTHDVRVYDGENYIIYAHFTDESFNKVNYINYFDANGRKYKREIFDTRGFLSVRKYLTVKQKILFEHILDTSGNIVIEKYYNPEAQKHTLTRMTLTYNNAVYHLNKESELLTIFAESIYKPGDFFFSDKNNVTALGLANTHSDIPVIAVLHSTHLKYEHSAEISNVKNTYKDLFNHLARFKGLITSTAQQREDVEKLIDRKLPVWNIPAGFIEEKDLAVIRPSAEVPRLISVARYAVEKQLDHQLRLVKKLKNDYSNIQLHMFGAGGEHAKLQKMIEAEDLTENVFLRGFVTDLAAEFSKSHVNLLTSRMEGFSLALLEASSYGVPSVSYDIEYGPSEIIDDGRTGYLVPLDDEEALYDKVRKLLEQRDSEAIYREVRLGAERYSKANTGNQWMQLIEALNK